MLAVKVFVDSNVLLYSHDPGEPTKFAAARSWLTSIGSRGLACTNLQVLNECASLLLRRRWFPSSLEAFAAIDAFRLLGDTPVTWAQVKRARALHVQTGYSWWDSLLLASALELGCTHFLSEDLQGDQTIDGLTIVDPFSTSPGDILLS